MASFLQSRAVGREQRGRRGPWLAGTSGGPRDQQSALALLVDSQAPIQIPPGR